MAYKMGCLPRTYDPAVPHLSALIGSYSQRRTLDASRDVDYGAKLPPYIGMMLNGPDPHHANALQLGDCTCTVPFHLKQVWSDDVIGKMDTESNACVLNLYEKACGYIKGDPSTDGGGVIQKVLTYCMNKGFRVKGGKTEKIIGFVEIDPRNDDDILLAIDECGGVDIGTNIPAYIMPQNGPPPSVWDFEPKGDQTIIGAHSVGQPGRVAGIYRTMSWGSPGYYMTKAFKDRFVTEIYGIISKDWMEKTGKTPFGLSLADWEAQMAALRQQP